jgi:hypothetical protein
MKLDFFDRLSKNTQIPNFMKIRPVGAELFQRDMTKAVVSFRNCANTPKMAAVYCLFLYLKISEE